MAPTTTFDRRRRSTFITLLLCALLGLPLSAQPVNAVKVVRISATRASIILENARHCAGLQFTLIAAPGRTFADVVASSDLPSDRWTIAWHQLDARTLRGVIMANDLRELNAGSPTLLSFGLVNEGLSESGIAATLEQVMVSDAAGHQINFATTDLWWDAGWSGGTEEDAHWVGNYPNPFNPATVLTYELHRPAFIRVAVYDMLGREVTVLEEGMTGVGRHAVTWTIDRHRVSSGAYVARLSTGGRAWSHRISVVQ